MLRKTSAMIVCSLAVLSGSAALAQKPRVLTPADLQKLQWIVGSWKGTGGGVPTFYERYRFENPTTLIVDTLENDKVKDTSRFELRNGEFGSSANGSSSVATAFDGTSITFANVGRAGSGWKWERVSENQWRAVIFWPASASRAAGERVYTLDRIGK